MCLTDLLGFDAALPPVECYNLTAHYLLVLYNPVLFPEPRSRDKRSISSYQTESATFGPIAYIKYVAAVGMVDCASPAGFSQLTQALVASSASKHVLKTHTIDRW